MADIFISYAREDIETARFLANALEQHNFTVFWDRRIPAGKRFDDYIGGELQAARCVIVVWSPVSVHSSWVREEASDGRDRGILVHDGLARERTRALFGRGSTAPGDHRTVCDWEDRGDIRRVGCLRYRWRLQWLQAA